MEISEIQKCLRLDKYEISYHAEKERYAENISLEAIKEAIFNGEVLEDYPDDRRGPSCLILGLVNNGPLHVVCGYSAKQWMRIITVYIPQRPKWVNERTRSRDEKR